MVINELKDNKVDIITDLYGLTAPVLSMRDNEYVVPFGGKLVLNYYVCPYYGAEYPNGDGTVTVGKKGMETFTFVARIDEDTLDLDQVPEFRQTTLEGEQVMEIDLEGMAAGPHSVLVQAISNGASSPTVWLKFRIKDENEEDAFTENTVDLSSFSNGEQFTSGYDNIAGSYIDADSGQDVWKPVNASLRYVTANDIPTVSGMKHHVAERVIVADYTVTRVSEDEISIVVDGQIYYTFVNNWVGFYRGNRPNNHGSVSRFGKNGMTVEDISGTYKLTDLITVGGTQYRLSDYIGTKQSDIPAAVVKAAVDNKIALSRLCEAVQAKYYGNNTEAGPCRLILPEGMDIVMDYHGFGDKADNSYVSLDRNTITTEEVNRERCWSRFPDRFVLDLNGSTLSVLLADDVESGPFLVIADSYDTHIVNGIVEGTYLHKDYSVSSLSESLCNIKIIGSEFCTFENIDNHYATGYDAECDGRKSLRWEYNYHSTYAINRVQLNRPGYIDLDGRIHRTEREVLDEELSLRYTEGVDDGNTTSTNIQNSLLHKIVNVNGIPSYRGRQPISSGATLLRGGHFLTRKPDLSDLAQTDSFFGPGGVYIYYYRDFDPDSDIYRAWLADMAAHEGEEGYLPDFEPLEFITAHKVRQGTPFLVPKGAKYYHMCALGKFRTGDWYGLQNKNELASLPKLHHFEYQASWVCGYKNCTFSHARTSIMNWHFAYQCFMRDSHTYELGDGRHVNFGGFSNQSFNIDIEDNSYACGMAVIDGLEVISGGAGTKIHHPIDFNISGVRGYTLNLQKNVFLGVLKNSYCKVENYIGYSHPIKFFRWVNNIFTTLSVAFSTKGASRGKMLVEDSNILSRSTSGTTEIVEKDTFNTGEISQ